MRGETSSVTPVTQVGKGPAPRWAPVGARRDDRVVVPASDTPAHGASRGGGSDTSDYRPAPALLARLFGAALAVVGVVVFATTLVVALLDLHTVVVLVVAGACLLLVAGLAAAASRVGAVLRLTPEGYVVRLVRGAGATRARWSEVEDAVTARVADADCVVLRLKDGRSTTVPVGVLAADRDVVVRDVRDRLKAARRRR